MILFENETSTEGLVNTVSQNQATMKAGSFGTFCQQYGAGAAIASTTTETSVLTTTKLAPQVLGNEQLASQASSVPLPVIPGNFLTLGTKISGKIWGTVGNTGTPNIRFRVVLKNSAGTVVYTLTDTAATAMSTITGNMEFIYDFDAITSAVGSSGSITARCGLLYGTSAIAQVKIVGAPAAVTVDTTASYTLDVLQTWGSNSASNTLTPFFAALTIS
jgi:hypothetical protein